MKKVLSFVVCLGVLSGCATQKPTQPVEQPVLPKADVLLPDPVPRGTLAKAALTDPNSPLSKRSVYFDFDQFTVKKQDLPLLQAHAGYLQAQADAKVLIQGHTDERGSREYNVGLGQRRANAVQKELNALGIADRQLEAVSFGEEKPRALGHHEKAWAENRRADIVYQGE